MRRDRSPLAFRWPTAGHGASPENRTPHTALWRRCRQPWNIGMRGPTGRNRTRLNCVRSAAPKSSRPQWGDIGGAGGTRTRDLSLRAALYYHDDFRGAPLLIDSPESRSELQRQ